MVKSKLGTYSRTNMSMHSKKGKEEKGKRERGISERNREKQNRREREKKHKGCFLCAGKRFCGATRRGLRLKGANVKKGRQVGMRNTTDYQVSHVK